MKEFLLNLGLPCSETISHPTRVLVMQENPTWIGLAPGRTMNVLSQTDVYDMYFL